MATHETHRREIRQIFDLVFKRLIQEASPQVDFTPLGRED
jgi:hypothetical protein